MVTSLQTLIRFSLRYGLVLTLAMMFISCSDDKSSEGEQYLSPNYQPRSPRATINMLIIHHTAEDLDTSLNLLTDKVKNVSAHYLIAKDGTMFRLVPEEFEAYHAGTSYWQGRMRLNNYSIGIELENSGKEAFTEPQMQALVKLATDIIARYNIPIENVLSHSDIASARKQDPSKYFDWQYLAEQGIGLWPDPSLLATIEVQDLSVAHTQDLLSQFGYAVPRHGYMDIYTQCAIKAFQRHFRPDRVDGQIDQQTVALLQVLLSMKTKQKKDNDN